MQETSDISVREVSFAHQEAAVFQFTSVLAGPSAVLLGDADNDPHGESELVVGGLDGTVSLFSVNKQPQASMTATGLGTITAITLGRLWLSSWRRQIVVATAEGVLHVFDIKRKNTATSSTNSKGGGDTNTTECEIIMPVCSLSCVQGVSTIVLAFVGGPVIVIGTTDGTVQVLKLCGDVVRADDSSDEETPRARANIRQSTFPPTLSQSAPSSDNYGRQTPYNSAQQRLPVSYLHAARRAEKPASVPPDSWKGEDSTGEISLKCLQTQKADGCITSLCIVANGNSRMNSIDEGLNESSCVVVGLGSGTVEVFSLLPGTDLLARLTPHPGAGLPLSEFGWEGGACVSSGAEKGAFSIAALDGRFIYCTVDNNTYNASSVAEVLSIGTYTEDQKSKRTAGSIISEGLPRQAWRTVWAHATKDALFASGTLPNMPQKEVPKESFKRQDQAPFLATCSWSGLTYLISPRGKDAMCFDPGPFLPSPLRGFAAGILGKEPALVYVAGDGEILVYLKLEEQVKMHKAVADVGVKAEGLVEVAIREGVWSRVGELLRSVKGTKGDDGAIQHPVITLLMTALGSKSRSDATKLAENALAEWESVVMTSSTQFPSLEESASLKRVLSALLAIDTKATTKIEVDRLKNLVPKIKENLGDDGLQKHSDILPS